MCISVTLKKPADKIRQWTGSRKTRWSKR